jgi:hypothetical protein
MGSGRNAMKLDGKARPLCAGVSVLGTMRALRHNVDGCGKTYIVASALRLRHHQD